MHVEAGTQLPRSPRSAVGWSALPLLLPPKPTCVRTFRRRRRGLTVPVLLAIPCLSLGAVQRLSCVFWLPRRLPPSPRALPHSPVTVSALPVVLFGQSARPPWNASAPAATANWTTRPASPSPFPLSPPTWPRPPSGLFGTPLPRPCASVLEWLAGHSSPLVQQAFVCHPLVLGTALACGCRTAPCPCRVSVFMSSSCFFWQPRSALGAPGPCVGAHRAHALTLQPRLAGVDRANPRQRSVLLQSFFVSDVCACLQQL